MYICIHIHLHKYICTYDCRAIRKCMRPLTHVFFCICIYVCIYIYRCICIFVSIYIYRYLCIQYIYIGLYIHVYIYMHTQTFQILVQYLRMIRRCHPDMHTIIFAASPAQVGEVIRCLGSGNGGAVH